MAKQTYITPTAETLSVRIEQGLALSGAGMTERIQDRGCHDIGDPNPYYPNGEPMTEGIINGGIQFF